MTELLIGFTALMLTITLVLGALRSLSIENPNLALATAIITIGLLVLFASQGIGAFLRG